MASATRPNVTEEHPLVPLTDYNKYKGAVRADPPALSVAGVHDRDHPAGDGVRLLAAAAARSDREHPHQPRRQQRGGSRSSAAPRSAPTSTSRTSASSTSICSRCRRRMIAGETFNVGYQNHTVAELAEMVRSTVRAGDAGEGADRDRDLAQQRPALLPHLLAQDRAEAGLEAEAHDRGRGASTCAAPSGPGGFPNSHDRRAATST